MQRRIFNWLEESWWRAQALHLPAVRHFISMCVNINTGNIITIIIDCSCVKLRSKLSSGYCHGTLYYIIILHDSHRHHHHYHPL